MPLSIDHGFLSDPDDSTVVSEGVESLRRLAAGDAVRAYAGRETRPGPEVDAMTHVRGTARGFFRPVATCAIGRVVDGGLRVYGLDGLMVADASIMVRFRFRGSNRDGPMVVKQQAYLNERDGLIGWMRLVLRSTAASLARSAPRT